MIRRLAIRGYKAALNVESSLLPFQVLLGPNASGKSTFVDSIQFISDAITLGVELAAEKRVENPVHLGWKSVPRIINFEIVIDLGDGHELNLDGFRHANYRLSVETGDNSIKVVSERLQLLNEEEVPSEVQLTFPELAMAPQDKDFRVLKPYPKARTLMSRTDNGKVSYSPDRKADRSKRWAFSFLLPSDRLGIGNIPDDTEVFAISSWVRQFLSKSITSIAFEVSEMRKKSPIKNQKGFLPDGSNLPWLVKGLKEKNLKMFNRWLAHVKESLPDVNKIFVDIDQYDSSATLFIEYDNGAAVPSSLLSDGTLRLLALTIIPYLDLEQNVTIIEEPENGIHPKALESVVDSLRSVYDGQILVASHSPLLMGMVKVDEILCFAKDKNGAVDIVSGLEHPRLQALADRIDLGALFAAGVLG